MLKRSGSMKRKLICKELCLAAGTIIFLLGYCASFESSILRGAFPSAKRYFSTILVACLLDMALQAVDINTFHFKTKLKNPVQRLVNGTIITAVMLVLILPSIRHSRTIDYHIGRGAWISSQIKAFAEETIEEKNINCFFCTVGDEADDCLIHHRTYNNLIGSGIRIKNFYSESNILPAYGGFSEAEEFMAYLKENDYKILYLYSVNDEFNEIYGSLFEGGKAEEYTTYKIDDTLLVK